MMKENLLTEDGPISVGSEVVFSGEICKVFSIVSENEVELFEYPGKNFLIGKEVFLIPKFYKVYSWNGYYIFAEDIHQAKIVWDSWIDNSWSTSGVIGEKINYKFAPDTYPKEYKKLKTQAPYPCITDSLDWEYPIYCYKENYTA